MNKADKIGYFSEVGNEYHISNYNTPRYMMNYLFNDIFISSVNHFGTGEGTYFGNSAKYLDPQKRGDAILINGGARYFYINNTTDNVIYSPGYYPVCEPIDSFDCIVGNGYQIIESRKNGIKSSLRCFVNNTDAAEIWTIQLENEGNSTKTLKFYSYVEFSLVGYVQYCGMQAYSYCEYFNEENMVFAYNNAIEKPHDFYNGYICSDIKPTGFDSSRESFIGTYGNINIPEIVKNAKSKNSVGSCETFCGALEHTIVLEPGETKKFNLLIGITDQVNNAKGLCKRIFQKNVIENELSLVKDKYNDLYNLIKISSPDKRLNSIVNSFLKNQIMLCIIVGRGGMKGFRDQLQDGWGASSFNPELARYKIIEVLNNIYKDGRCVRGFDPVDSHIYSDGPTWAASAVNAYIKETGDISILDVDVNYLDDGKDTVWEHLLKTTEYSYNDSGKHGLILARDGDWNDSLNYLCLKGKGESVWTSIALVKTLENVVEIASFIKNDKNIADKFSTYRDILKDRINKYAWDGEWYLAGFNDLGEAVGSCNEEEGMIYLNPQTWAVYAGVADKEKTKICLNSVDNLLLTKNGPLTLFPPYTKLNSNIGRLTGFVPGIWENGTPYCHGGTFKIVADCCAERPNEAYETIKRILPDSEYNPSTHSGCEPYALTNMYFGPQNIKSGKSIIGWITGTAGWMFRAVTEYIFGFKPGYDCFEIKPCIPDEWKKCSITRKFRGSIYEITIHNENNGKCSIKKVFYDGEQKTSNIFSAVNDNKTHIIEIFMG